MDLLIQVGTTLFINYANNDDEHGFLRYVNNGSKNTGGGIKNLAITVLSTSFRANIVTLFSDDLYDVSFWTADTVILDGSNFAKRTLFARSFPETGTGGNKWNVRDINLTNCYFNGITTAKSTIAILLILYISGCFIY